MTMLCDQSVSGIDVCWVVEILVSLVIGEAGLVDLVRTDWQGNENKALCYPSIYFCN